MMYPYTDVIIILLASQMHFFGFTLPLMIGYFIPDDDEHWQLFLQMMDIVDHLFSPKLSAEHATYVATLIREHHEEFSRLYPHRSIIPKMYFMIHMPRLIREYV